MNTITKLSGYFERFGTIVNLQVRYEGDPESAIVQFSSPFEAKAAHDCTEAVLNNRFIRVYYLKVNTGGGIATDNKPPLDHSQVMYISSCYVCRGTIDDSCCILSNTIGTLSLVPPQMSLMNA
jgi:hypothetical protein